jgi:hypothetical protein
MCREVDIADIRTALMDYCEVEDDNGECALVEDLLAEIVEPIERAVGKRTATGSAVRRDERAG